MKIIYDNTHLFSVAGGTTLAEASALISDEISGPVNSGLIVLQPETPKETRNMIRHEIAQSAGDQQSLLGTTSDAASLAVYGLAVLVNSLNTATTIAEVRAAAEPFAALSADFLAKITSGDVKLPFLEKGIAGVVADIETRSTAVADVLAARVESA